MKRTQLVSEGEHPAYRRRRRGLWGPTGYVRKGSVIVVKRSRRTWALIFLRYALLVLILVFAAYYLVSQWAAVSQAIKLIAPLSIILSFALVVAGLVFGTISWVAILNGLGPRVPVLRAAQILLVGQLGKYVPGSVWSYVMQMELGRQYGVSRPRVLITALYAAGVGVVASLILGSLALPILTETNPQLIWLFALLPIGLVCLHPKVMTWLASLTLRVFRRPPLDHTVSFTVILTSLGSALAAYACYGLHLFVLVNSLVDPNFVTLVLLTGAISIGFTVSLVAFFLPSGIGAREAVLIGAMTLLLTVPQAAAVSVVSRMMFTVADVSAAAAAVLAVVILRRRLAVLGSANVEALEVSTAEGSRAPGSGNRL